MLKPAPSSPPARAVRPSAGLVLALLSAPLLLPLAGCGPSSGSRPTAWQEAPSPGIAAPPMIRSPCRSGANELAPLLRQGEGLGPPPHSRGRCCAGWRPSAGSTRRCRRCSGAMASRWTRSGIWAGRPIATTWSWCAGGC